MSEGGDAKPVAALPSIDAALFDHVLVQPVIGLDQTGWPRLGGSGAKKWQMWCLTAPGVVVHRIRDDKSAATFTSLVGKKSLFTTMVTTHGVKANPHRDAVVDVSLDLSALFG